MKQGVGAGALSLGGALMAAASGGSIVAAAESMMSTATEMVTPACVPLPPVIMVTFCFKESTGKPSSLEKAAKAWSDAAKELNDAAREIRELVQEIPGEAWTMDDRPLYESNVSDYAEQLDAMAMYCEAVQMAIMVVAYALFTYAVFAMGMAVYIDALAIMAGLVAASIVGNIAIPEIEALAMTAAMITRVATGILAVAGVGAAATMGGGAISTAVSQDGDGADAAFSALGHGAATGSAGSLANFAQAGANTGLNWLNREGGKGNPLQEIDLDADRSIDKTWNVGANAKVALPKLPGEPEGELGYHAKIRNGDVEGQELEFKAKATKLPHDLQAGGGGKVEWDGHENVSGGGFNGAVEAPKIGSKGEYEGAWDDKGKYSDKYNVNTPIYNRTDGSTHKKPDDEAPPWDKNL